MVGGFFVINNNLSIDLVNPKMLRCIIFKSKQVVANILNKGFSLCKGLIKYNKANGVTPIKTHVDSAHFCLVVKRKLILIKKSMVKHVDSYLNQQLGMKKVGSSWSTITTFFGSANPYKHGDESEQRFFENLVD